MKPLAQLNETGRAKRLRDMIQGHWDESHDGRGNVVPGLAQDEREALLAILNEWVDILESEGDSK
jgi:CxxC motif-containing protein (DUF1111 family)